MIGITLRQLEYAVAVADELHFGRAADRCAVSQPGLSAQLAELERQLGVRLFERDRRKILLTAAGEELVPRARAVLAEAAAIEATGRRLRAPLEGDLRIGVIPTVAPYLLPRILPAIRARFPKLRPLLREDQTARLVEKLGRGELDLLLLALDADLGALETLELFHDPFLLAVPKGHRLAGTRPLRERELDGEKVLLLEDGHCLRDQALSLCQTAGASELGDFRGSSLTTLVHMVASGIGITLLPALAADAEVRPGEPLVVRPFTDPPPERRIGLAWRPGSARREEIELLARTIREILPTTGAGGRPPAGRSRSRTRTPAGRTPRGRKP